MNTSPAPETVLLGGFAPEEFRARRAALRAACPDGIVLIRGALEEEVVVGSASLYRQNSSFAYLTGVHAPGAVLALLPEAVPAGSGLRNTRNDLREFLFLPPRDRGRETWTGPKIGPGAETEKLTGVEKTVASEMLWSALSGWLRRCPVVYLIAPYGEGATLTRDYALMRRIADIAPIAQFRDCALPLSRQRMVKTPAELEQIRRAIAVTTEGQKAARALIAAGAGRGEYEAEARVLEAFRSRGAAQAFPAIVGGGINGTVLHYEDNAALMNEGDLVVVDIGARVGPYCGDLTRTYPVGGRFATPRQREIYDAVYAAHQDVIARFQPGTDTLETINDRCKAFLKNLPLRAKDSDNQEQTLDVFMPHGLSHHLGLDVHDVGPREIPLPVGSVITVEPGVYILSEGIGVRLEDDYLVTEGGLERLGPPLEMAADDVVRAMTSAN